MTCPTTGNCKNGLLSAIVLFAFFWAFNYFVHGHLLMKLYEQTADVWRNPDEMQALGYWCILHMALLALIIAGGYQCWRSKITVGAVGSCDCPYRKSMKFGIWVGLLLGLTNAGYYVYLPIPQELAIAWLVSEVVKGALAGIVLQLMYRPKAGTTA